MKNGNIIGPKNNSSPYSSKGLWSLKEQYKNNKNNLWQKQINTNGLITWLDAANPSSYSGSGTTWLDLSGNGQNFTIYGSTSFNSAGYFTFGNNQITDYIMRQSYAVPTTQITMSFWFRSNFSSNAQTPITYSVAGNNEMLFFLDNPAQLAPHPKGVRWNLSTSSMLNKWVNFTWTRDSLNGQNVVYRNGERLGAYTETINNPITTGGSMIIGQEADSTDGGFDPNQNLDGDFSHLLVYNRILTEAEIKNNFYALADRYSLRAAPEFSASGGATSYINGYMIHTFTSSGTFLINSANVRKSIEYLVVAGGGGGGGSTGGGGGAGGVIAGSVTANLQSYTITVGAGGNGSANRTSNGTNGGDSSAFGITSTGGGKGAGTSGSTVVLASTSGGSGGGGAAYGSVSAPGSAGIAGQGFAGGSMAGPGDFVHPGGGGAGGPGSSGGPGGNGAGGIGIQSSITGTSTYYGGGGGGALGGIGGLGGGGSSPGSGSGGAGVANTGGGGAGGWAYSTTTNPNGGGNGGSGIVVVRYLA
jgi:hypothetical protein